MRRRCVLTPATLFLRPVRPVRPELRRNLLSHPLRPELPSNPRCIQTRLHPASASR